ncbi:MAG: NHLP family bacteriocin export ABC transporter peptidase/permease/ATPase subunit [Eggerthellaceae bacterium]|nr:NHLP family bacteriocin export ABC transporter peptidase/permease/ATPase subunit [Eggerthellaceae bacterium]
MGSKDIKQPLRKGVAKVPVIMQLEALECGAASLAMVMAYYDKWVPLEQVRADCGVSRDGSKAKNVALAAMRYGFEVKAYRYDPQTIQKEASFPCIIHWNMNHFVVLDGFKGGKAYLNDPARGDIEVTMEEFDECFTGVTIIPTPGPDFEPSGQPKSTLEFAKKRLVGAGAAVAFVMITTAIGYLFGIINSFTSRIFMDRLLTGVNPDWVEPFIFMMVGLAILQLVVAWAQAVYSLRINGKMAVIGSTSYMWKVLRLPMSFFSQRQAGDIQARLALNASIAGTLVNTLAPLLLNTVMAVFYLAVMLKQSVPLTLIGLAALVINIAVSRYISTQRVNITRVQMRDLAKLASTKASGISMIETIKSSGAENGFFQKWAGYQASVNTQAVKVNKTDMLVGKIPLLLADIANYGVLVLGVYLTMQGEYTLGGVMMFQGFLSSFMTPAQSLVTAGQTIQEMRTQMERVEDVMEYPEDEALTAYTGDADGETQPMRKLQGGLELKNVTFGYSKLEEPLIEDFSLTLAPGERVALVGPSGCGKSTVAKLVSGLYQPWSGEILFDGKPRSAYPRDVVVGSLAVVDQDITLFEDTISANIRMWDPTIEDFEVIMAAHDARLHDDIAKLPDGYLHKLSSGGKNLSGGQRQRMEIARVLVQDPTIVIMDEATSALDARTEHEVVNAIHERGITCMVIAHRLSTVRDCDEIIVLDRGKVVERGTHDELIAKGGAYADLVASE